MYMRGGQRVGQGRREAIRCLTVMGSPSTTLTKNALQLIFPVFDGVANLTVTHFSVYDALTGGNMLVYGALLTARTVQNGDVFVVDVQKLTVQVL